MRPQDRLLTNLALAVTLAFGAGFLWLIVATYGFETLTQSITRPVVVEQLAVSDDGTPYVMYYEWSNYNSRRYRTPEGQPVTPPAGHQWVQRDILKGSPRKSLIDYPAQWTTRIYSFIDQEIPANFWFAVVDSNERAHLVGYDTLSKSRIGFLSKEGFTLHEPTSENRFPLPSLTSSIASPQGPRWGAAYPWSSELVQTRTPGKLPPAAVYLSTGREVYEIDLSQRSVARILDREEGDIRSVNVVVQPGGPDKPSKNLLLARTDDTVLRFDVEKRSFAPLPLPDSLVGQWLDWYTTVGGDYIATVNSKTGIEFYHLAADGKVVRQERIAIATGAPLETPLWSLAIASVLPAPVGMAIISGAISISQVGTDGIETLSQSLQKSAGQFWPGFTLVIILSVFLAWLADRRLARLHADARTRRAWIALILFGGAPAYVGFLLHRTWPARKRTSEATEGDLLLANPGIRVVA